MTSAVVALIHYMTHAYLFLVHQAHFYVVTQHFAGAECPKVNLCKLL